MSGAFLCVEFVIQRVTSAEPVGTRNREAVDYRVERSGTAQTIFCRVIDTADLLRKRSVIGAGRLSLITHS